MTLIPTSGRNKTTHNADENPKAEYNPKRPQTQLGESMKFHIPAKCLKLSTAPDIVKYSLDKKSKVSFFAENYISPEYKNSVLIENDADISYHPAQVIEENEYLQLELKSEDCNSLAIKYLNVLLLEAQGAVQIAKKKLYEIEAPLKEVANTKEVQQLSTKLALKGSFYDSESIAQYQIVLNFTTSADEALNILKKLWRVFGPTVWLTQHFVKVHKRFSSVLKSSGMMLLAAYFCEAGEYKTAIKIAFEAKKTRKETWEENRYLGLINLLVAEGHLNQSWAMEYAKTFKRISIGARAFPSVLKEQSNSLVIVGNSPCILEQEGKEKINKSSFVIRFNTGETQYPLSEYVGTKTDALVLNPDYSQTRRFWENNSKYIIISNGDLYSSANIGSKLHDIHDDYSVHFIPSYIDRTVTQKIGASPSSGLKMLYWIYSLNGRIPNDRVFGFSLGDQPVGHSTSYSKPDPTRMPIVHDWQAEQELLKTLVES